jgi:hypothetical protein
MVSKVEQEPTSISEAFAKFFWFVVFSFYYKTDFPKTLVTEEVGRGREINHAFGGVVGV